MITGIHHATFLTADLAHARGFYEGVLGLQPDAARPQMSFEGIWYFVGGGAQLHLMLLPDASAGVPRPLHGGRDRHVALSVSDWDGLMARLERAGCVYTLSQSGRRALFCRDPDQNALEFIEVN
ncbi:MAG TPA: glyoxalase [Gallionella sp.]|nr:MAG: glyoxalase [Gallionellales bacterium GWA2_54_124]OGT19214.1 MAG: glyoxalase [Gallionellales bacterium RIFOXYD12_FULL_53_10]HCI52307.1 glyoxalase [Gallionella sp.]